jgi:hypothetical protein
MEGRGAGIILAAVSLERFNRMIGKSVRGRE